MQEVVEMQLIKIFIPTKEGLNLILDTLNEVPTFLLQVIHWELAHHLLPFPMASWLSMENWLCT